MSVRTPGRPRIYDERMVSITVRILPATRAVIEELARVEGRTVTEIARDTLDAAAREAPRSR